MTDDLSTWLRDELAEMASTSSVDMELWDRFSNHVLEAADALEAQARRIAELEEDCEMRRAVNFGQLQTIDGYAARIAELEAALKDTTVRLVAAISLLERGGKKAAPSNKMFEQMLVDYKNGVERARAAYTGEKG